MVNVKKSNDDKIKIFCDGGKPIYITKTRHENIRRQIVRDIKRKRSENRNLALYYFYGLAYFVYHKEDDSASLVIEYGDELSSLGVNKRDRIYVEVLFKTRTTKKHGTIIL